MDLDKTCKDYKLKITQI